MQLSTSPRWLLRLWADRQYHFNSIWNMLASLPYRTSTQQNTSLSCFPTQHNTRSLLVTWQRWLVCDKNMVLFQAAFFGGFFSFFPFPETHTVIVVNQPVIALRRKSRTALKWSVFLRNGGKNSYRHHPLSGFVCIPLFKSQKATCASPFSSSVHEDMENLIIFVPLTEGRMLVIFRINILT